jgi:PST family polysaccharide transporter
MVVAEVTYIASAITLAVAGVGVWSLVYAVLLQAVVQATMSWLMVQDRGWLKWQPWDGSLVKQLMSYGMRSVASRAVYFFYSNADNFIVGKLMGSQALGFYSKAFDFTSKTVDNVHRAVGVVLFPSYARIQNDLERLTKAYLKSLKTIALLTIPMAVGILLLAPEIVAGLLGKKWIPMTPIVEVLALMSLVKPLSSTTSALFQSTGHPGYNFRAGLLVSVVMVPGILLLLPYETVGAAFAVFVAHVVGLLYNVHQVQSILPKTALRMAKAVLPAVAGSALMGGGMWLLRVALTDLLKVSSPVVLLVLMFFVGLGIYAAFVFRTQGPEVREILELIKKRRRGAKGVGVASGGSVKQP